MAKAPLNDPNRSGTRYHLDPDRGSFGGGRKGYAGGGRGHIQSGPAPGERSGVTRSDGPTGRATGTSRDLQGAPRAPKR
jgi:hypothetical protein